MKRIVVALFGACASTPPPAPSVASSHVANPPGSENYPTGTIEVSDDRFPWQKLRDECAMSCREQMAGRASNALYGSRPRTTGIRIDRGKRHGITMAWEVALLDDTGLPLMPWSPVLVVNDDETIADVPLHISKVGNHRHVGMRRHRDIRVPDHISH